MKLYAYPGAPNPRRIYLYLAEKGLDVPCETAEITTRANRTPEFMEQRNRLDGIPVLELDDGSHRTESVAICRYFEVHHNRLRSGSCVQHLRPWTIGSLWTGRGDGHGGAALVTRSAPG